MTHDEVEFVITTPVPAKRDVARQTKIKSSRYRVGSCLAETTLAMRLA
jgi:hypothetical protein